MAQAALIRSMGATPVVVATKDGAHSADAWRLAGAESRIVRGAGPTALAYAPGMMAELLASKLDILHLHGIWQYPSYAASAWARASGKPLVISPHGMLDPWITRRNRWKKRLAMALWERRSWRAASAFHALTEAEAADIAHECGGASVAIIPNPAPPLSASSPAPRSPSALYIGRIHEKKNLAALIGAWLSARSDLPPGATLTIAGWGDEAGIDLLERTIAGGLPSVEFVGTAFGSQKAALLDIARFVVLLSLSEGLPMAILEAWAAGVPTIMSDACHLPEGFAAGAAIRCGADSAAIRAALIESFALPETKWQAMSNAARGLAATRFAPEQVARAWENLYAAVMTGERV